MVYVHFNIAGTETDFFQLFDENDFYKAGTEKIDV